MRGVRVLVIEDDADVAATLVEALTERGYHVSAVTTAEDGLKVIPSLRPDVLLLDIWLPGLSGPGMLAEFRKAHPGLPVIVLTSEVDREMVGRISDMKPVHLVQKPFDADILHGLITDAVDPRHR